MPRRRDISKGVCDVFRDDLGREGSDSMCGSVHLSDGTFERCWEVGGRLQLEEGVSRGVSLGLYLVLGRVSSSFCLLVVISPLCYVLAMKDLYLLRWLILLVNSIRSGNN